MSCVTPSWSVAMKKKQLRVNEFGLIERFFRPLAVNNPGSASLQDDCATLSVKNGYQAIYSMDTMVEGVHFFKDDPADLIAKKLLRVNLSDLAASGGDPLGYLLALCLPHGFPLKWLESFAAGLQEDQRKFNVSLLGGDTTSSNGPITLSITAIGEIPKDRVIRRAGAMIGDDIFVSGCIGDAAIALKLFGEIGKANTLKHYPSLYDRYTLPEPRIGLGKLLAGTATACIDVSDGLYADLNHICLASKVGAKIEMGAIPLSKCVKEIIEKNKYYWESVYGGGDDYELLFTANKDQRNVIDNFASILNIAISKVGCIELGKGISILDQFGDVVPVKSFGWQHF